MHNFIIHQMPGRVRFKFHELKRQYAKLKAETLSKKIKHELLRLYGVNEVIINDQTGSLLVIFDNENELKNIFAVLQKNGLAYLDIAKARIIRNKKIILNLCILAAEFIICNKIFKIFINRSLQSAENDWVYKFPDIGR